MKEEKLIMLRGQSVFAPYIAEFVRQKRALGCKYNAAAEALNMFDSFCAGLGITEPKLTDALYEAWCRKRPAENGTTHQIRVTYIRQFSAFLHDNGMEAVAAFHPLPKRSKAFVPYIFTADEIQRLMDAVDRQNAVPVPGTPVRHLVYPVLFRMLYGCGLRASEAAKLKTADVDLDAGTAVVRMAKGGKDRMVAMSDSLTRICRGYRMHGEIQAFESEYFFPSRDHGYYDTSTLYADFRKYLRLCGIPHKGRGKGPRLHDLRHSYAVHVLNGWAAQGKDLYACLPILQRHLGHARISATEKYLQLVPDAFAQVTGPFESRFGGVFPEVADEEG